MPDLNTREGITSTAEMKDEYDFEYPNYVPDQETIRHLKTLTKNKKFIIILGIWCGDSKLQVPRFFKILDQAGVDEKQVTLICVDQSKKAERGLTDNLNIDRIPVFILTENDREIGRITETPVYTLENDMVKILTKK